MQTARISLSSAEIDKLNNVLESITDIVKKTKTSIKGPISMPTKRLKVTTRKSPDGEGRASFDRFEMRIHKRLIDLPANEKVLRQIMKMQIPKSVNVKIEMKD